MHAFQAMNTTLFTKGLTAAQQAKAEAWFAFVERSLSRFRPDSELSALNRASGKPFLASALLYETLETAHRYYEESGGLFTPYLGAEIAALGYDVSFERLTKTRAPAAPAAGADRFGARAAEARNGAPPAELDRRLMSVVLRKGVAADLGGFAKGWSADQLAGMLRKEGVKEGAIDAGGDIAVWGTPRDGWEIGVANPFAPDADLLTLRLAGPAGIATSSTLKRRWTLADGSVRHHLIDPRRLLPVETDLVQATVMAPSLTEAEVYAKCLLLLGSDAGPHWFESAKPGFAFVAIRGDGSVLAGGDWHAYDITGGNTHASVI